MRISFVGDIVCRNFMDKNFQVNIESFRESDITIANLEGPILELNTNEGCNKNNGIGLYSNNEVLKLIDFFEIDALFLGNNHINDFGTSVKHTTDILELKKIKYCGAGTNSSEANKPISFLNDTKEEVLVYGFGWENSGCKIATSNADGVNRFEYNHVMDTLKEIRNKNTKAVIIFLFNWNYDMEILPHPAYRRFSQELIDNGLDAVIGLHPHIVQGIEIYNNKPIVYGIGNWYIPQEIYCGKKVSFPDICNEELKVELIFEGRELKNLYLDWYKYDKNNHSLSFKYRENYKDSKRIKELTKFSQLTNKEYDKFFRRNRRNKKFIPIYYNLKSPLNFWKDLYHHIRQSFVNFLVNLKIKTHHSQ